MKKTALLLTAAALACASAAMAQSRDETRPMHDADATRSAPETPRKGDTTLGQSMHRLGDKARAAVHRMGNAMHARRDSRDHTRAMGAGRPDPDRDRDLERERRDRMDRAYESWKSRQHERSGDPR